MDDQACRCADGQRCSCQMRREQRRVADREVRRGELADRDAAGVAGREVSR